MKKLFIIILFTVFLSPIYSIGMGSASSINFMYYSAFDYSQDLNINSNLGTTIKLVPLYVENEKIQFALTNSLTFLFESQSNPSALSRPFNGFDFGLSFGVNFSKEFSLQLEGGFGLARLGISDNEEAYFFSNIVPSYQFYTKEIPDMSVVFPISLIYRKKLIHLGVGVGLKADFNWISNLFNNL